MSLTRMRKKEKGKWKKKKKTWYKAPFNAAAVTFNINHINAITQTTVHQPLPDQVQH